MKVYIFFLLLLISSQTFSQGLAVRNGAKLVGNNCANVVIAGTNGNLIIETTSVVRNVTLQLTGTILNTGTLDLGNCISVPFISVKQGTSPIAHSTGSYNFGNVNVGSNSTDISFTIENTGSAALNLTGTPKILLNGADAAQFSVNQASTLGTVNAAGTTSFTVKFSPTSSGSKTAFITIVNNSGTNPYTFVISGTAPPVTTTPPSTGSGSTSGVGNTSSTGGGNTTGSGSGNNSGTGNTGSTGGSPTNTGSANTTNVPTLVPLKAPQISLYSKGATDLVLTWSDLNTDETGYEIWRAEGDQPLTKIGQVRADMVRFEDTGLIPNALYRYQIKVFRKDESKLSEIFETRTLPQKPFVAGVRVCEGSSASIRVMGLPSEGVYVWYENNRLLLESPNQTLTVQNMTSARQFSVSVKAYGQESERIAVKNEVLPIPVAQILEGTTLVLCDEYAQLSALKQTGEYIWEKDGFLLGKTEKITVTESGIYTLRVRNELCESNQVEIKVDLIKLPKTPISANQTSLCGTGAEVYLAVPYTEGATYEWTRNGQFFAKGSNQIKTGLTGAYQVRSSLKGCVQVSQALPITSEEPKNAQIIQTYTCDGQRSILSAPVYANYTYKWYKYVGEKPVLITNTPSFETSENNLHIYLEMQSSGCKINEKATIIRAKIEPALSILENSCEKKSLKLQGNLTGGFLQIRNVSGAIIQEMDLGTQPKEISLEKGIYLLEYNHKQVTCQQKSFITQVSIQDCIVSSAADEALARAISVYPNPTQDKLHIHIQDNSRGKVGFKIYTVQGQELQSWQVQKQGESLDYEHNLSGLATGVYFLEIRTEQGLAHKRVIKE